MVGAQLELLQRLAVLAFGMGVEGLHLEHAVAPGDVGLADAERAQVSDGDALLLLEAGFHVVEVGGRELAGLGRIARHPGELALAGGLHRELGGHLGFFDAHEHLRRGIRDHRFGFLVVIAQHRRNVLGRENKAESERARLRGHDRQALHGIVADFV